MVKRYVLLLLLVSLSFPVTLFAAGGCGFGARLYSDSFLAELGAISADAACSVSNSLSITSGTSGCSSSGLVKHHQQKHYVSHTIANLEDEISQGEGPYLNSLAELLGCSVSVQPEFSNVAQHCMDQLLIEADDPEQKAEAFLFALKANMAMHTALRDNCTAF